jgi:hypothetical protein
VEKPQAQLCVDGVNHTPTVNPKRLTLNVLNSPPPLIDQATTKPIFRSATWELWFDHLGKYLFVGPQQEPSRMIVVDNAFTDGVVMGDFNNHPGDTILPLGDLEIRLFSVWFAESRDIILHASGVMVDQEGYAFIGTSGAGKSTLASQLSKHESVTVLGEDQVILRYIDQRFWIFGTPWHENPSMCSPAGVPLEKLFTLDRSLKPGIHPITPLDGITRILQTAVIPYYRPDYMPAILDRLALLSEQVPFYALSYPIGADPLEMIKNG